MKMPIEKTKLNILNRVIDFGADTEKIIWLLLGISAAAILIITGRKRNADKDI